MDGMLKPMAEFRIEDVSTWPRFVDETVGSKRKVWLEESPAPDARRWLFKYRHHPWTGDDWAEKVATEIAALLEIPHASVELAQLGAEPGSISLDFTERRLRGELVLGNNL